MKAHYTLNIELTLIGPILTTGGETVDPGIDAPMACDRHGRWMLPFSLIKGKVLDAISELRSDEFEERADETDTSGKRMRFFPKSAELKDWLGLPSDRGEYEPERGRLRFSDFHTEQSGNPDNVIERIQIDSEAGAVAGRMLLMVQAPFGYGERVTFEGTVDFIGSEDEAKRIKSLIDAALRWVPAHGAYRTVGFGRTKAVSTDLAKTETRSTGTLPSSATLPFVLQFDRPLCLVGRKHSQNHFDSLEVVSGTVLKGAVAQMIRELTGSAGRDVSAGAEFPTLRKHFDKIRFSEARPRSSDAEARPVEPPLSIVTCPVKMEGDHAYFDVSLEERSCLIHGAAPAFMPDWKDADFGTVRGAFGWPLLPRERRTRTAINPTTGRAADQQLFSYGLVLPDRTVRKDQADTRGTKIEFVWDGSIGLEEVPDGEQASVRQDLEKLLNYGVVGIGKTRAVGIIDWNPKALPAAVASTPIAGKEVIITLQSDCLMTNPDTLQNGSADPLREAYSEFWSEVSNGSLDLTRFFARQSLYGSFVSQRARQDRYEPFLLTDRGSVFVLSIADSEKAPPLIQQWQQQWQQQGLPNASWMTGRYAPNGEPLWQRCPYIRENGYGEIAVNLECHSTQRIPSEKLPAGATS